MELWVIRHGETVDNMNHVLQGHQPGKLSELGILQAELTGVKLSQQKFAEVYCSDLARARETTENIIKSFKNKEIIPINYSYLLRERGFGVLEGLAREEAYFTIKGSGMNIRDFKPEGGESWHDVHLRVNEFLDSLLTKYLTNKQVTIEKKELKGREIEEDLTQQTTKLKITDEEENKEIEFHHNKRKVLMSANNKNEIPKILVVTHRGYMTELFTVINKRINKDFSSFGTLGNCSITVVKVSQKEKEFDNAQNIHFDFILEDDVSHLNENKTSNND